MSNLRVLVSGSGIAGPATAYWLTRFGASVTIVERAPELRTAGQNVDIRGAGLDVIRRMGLEEVVRSRTTKEEGIAFVDSTNRVRGKFGVDPGEGQSFTSDIEILRGELGSILYEKTVKDVEYIFGDYIRDLADNGNKVEVTFANSPQRREFDLVIGADGMGSKTRRFISSDPTIFRSLDQYMAYFTIPHHETDGTWARWYNAPGGRSILLRPDGTGATRAFLSIMTTSEQLKTHAKLSPDKQKELLHALFANAGWEAPRVLAEMDKAPDFYMQTVAQVKMNHWSRGRVAVVGDAGYCPSPITGMGTSLAIVGSYVLAGEVMQGKDDIEAALRSYEEVMRPYVTKAQKIFPGAPRILNPETAWGIWFLLAVLSFVS